jgi:hypothetical protein
MANDSEIKISFTADTSELQEASSESSAAAEQINQSLLGTQAAAEQAAQGLLTSFDQIAKGAAEAAGSIGSAMSSIGESFESAAGWGESLKSVGEFAGGFFTGLQLENAAESVKGFFEEATVGTFEFSENLKNLSLSTGLTTDQLQVLQYAGDVVGTGMGRLQQTVNSVARAMTEFADGSKRATEAASTLGLDPSKWTSAFDALEQIGEKYKELTASGQQLSLANEEAFQVFLGGRFGMQSLAALERLPELEEQARDAGVIMGSDTIEASDQAAEAIHRLSAEWGALEHAIGGALAPAATLAAQGVGERVFGLQPPEEGGGAAGGSGQTGEMQAEQIEPAKETQAQLKAIFNQTVSDYEASQRLILAAAGDTAEARMAYEKNVLTFLESQEGTAAAAGVDLSAKIGEAAVAGAAAQTAAYKESNEALKAGAAEVQAYVRQEAEDQMNALDTMYEEFKTEGTDVLEHIKEKWGEVNAAEQEAKQDLKDTTTEIAGMLEPLGASFDEMFNSMLAGGTKTTQTLTQEFMKMAQSITEELIKSGIKDLLVGGKEGSIGGALSTALTGQSGGIAGEIAKAFTGSAIATSLRTALSSAWTGLTGIISNVFGSAFTGIEGIIKSVFGSAVSGAGGGAADAGASAAGGAAAKALGNMDSSLVTLVAQSAMGLAQDAAYYAESLGDFIMMIITEATSVHPFGFSGGGIVPSAAGGMVVPGGGGASLNILHPREMVLPPHLSEGIQNAIEGGSFGGGGGSSINVAFSVQTLDTTTMATLLRQQGDVLGDIIAQKVRDGRYTGQGVNRGAFRR